MFLQRFTCCLPHSLGCLLPACHDRQFRHQIVFLLHTIQHIHASQMHMISQIKYVFTKIYFNRFPKGGTSRRPLVLSSFIALLSGITSLGCGQHLTSETCFFNLKHTHFGIHTTQFVYFRQSVSNTFKKVAVSLFFLRSLQWAPPSRA